MRKNKTKPKTPQEGPSKGEIQGGKKEGDQKIASTFATPRPKKGNRKGEIDKKDCWRGTKKRKIYLRKRGAIRCRKGGSPGEKGKPWRDHERGGPEGVRWREGD